MNTALADKNVKIAKWKLYAFLITLITVGTLVFNVLTAYVTYPSAEHRRIGQELATLDSKAFSPNSDYEKIVNSDKYKDLTRSREAIYTTRMAVGVAALSTIIGVAIVVALYRFLRRNHITTKPIRATVLIDTVATALIMISAILISEPITGIKNEPITITMLLIAVPFAVGFSALITFMITKITERYYNRSHDPAEE